MLTTTDALGNVSRMAYNGLGEPTSSTDPLGDTTTLGYDADGNLTTTTSPGPNYGQNAPGTIDLPAGVTTTMAYDEHGNVVSTATPDGTTGTAYDQYGDVSATTDARNNQTSFTYDANGNQTSSQWTRADGAGATHTFKTVNIYDNNDQLTETDTYEDGALQTTTTTAYDADGHAVSSTDEYGGVTTTLYDADGRVVRTTSPDGLVTDTVYDAQGRVWYTDDPHAPTSTCDGTETFYDANGDVVATERVSGLVLSVTTADGTSSSAFTAQGGVLSVADTVYDSAGRVTDSDGPHAPGNSASGTHTVYDADGRATGTEQVDGLVIALTVGTGDTASTSVTNAGTVVSTTTTAYDAAGRVVSSTLATADGLDRTTSTVYDGDGRAVKAVGPDGQSTRTVYDANGRKISTIDAMGHATNYQYDTYGDLAEVDLPAVIDPVSKGLTRPAYRYAHDAQGDLIGETVPDETNPAGDTTTYGYDAQGRKTSETLPSVFVESTGQTTTPTETWTYNALGQLTTSTDFDGDITDYEYYGTGSTLGAPGQLETKSVYAPGTSGMDGMGGSPPTLYETTTYEYHQNEGGDGSYQDVVIDSLAGTTTTTYDVEGQVRQVASPQGTIDYEYDPATGAKTEMYTLDSSSNHVTDITYVYNDLVQLTTVTATKLDGQAVSLTTSYTYDDAGELKTTTQPNGAVETENYDADGRVSSISTVDGSTTVFSASYTRDANGDVTRDVESLNGTAQEFGYSYDADGRLTQETIDQGAASPRTLTWTYDLAGNRYESTDSAATDATSDELYSYNADGELTGISDVGGGGGDPGMQSVTYTYDAAGNQTSMSGPTGSSTSTWAPTGLLAQIVVTDGSGASHTITYGYDANGERVSETTSAGTTTYLNDPTSAYDQALEEYAPSGVLATTYVRGVNLLFQDRSGTQSYYALDQLGSVRELTDATGTVANTYTYDAYGNMISQSGTMPNAYQYAGMMLDAATGQYYDHARNYQAGTGTFTSRDSYNGSLDDPITLNHYLYVGADPINGIDPSGHDGLLVSLNVSISLGEAITIGAAGLAATSFLSATALINGLNPLQSLEIEVLGWISEAQSEATYIYNSIIQHAATVATAITNAINTAVEAGLGTAAALDMLPMFPVIRSWTPKIYDFDTSALSAHPGWYILTYNGPKSLTTARNRQIVKQKWGRLMDSAPSDYQLDEFPYASTAQGGVGALGKPVPASENALQGGLLSALYRYSLKGTAGRIFLVVPAPF